MKLKDYFAACLSSISLEPDQGRSLQSSKFFPSPTCVLESRDGVDQIHPSASIHSLPDIPTREEVHRLINTVRQSCATGLFCWLIYSWACASVKKVALEVSDIGRVHSAKPP